MYETVPTGPHFPFLLSELLGTLSFNCLLPPLISLLWFCYRFTISVSAPAFLTQLLATCKGGERRGVALQLISTLVPSRASRDSRSVNRTLRASSFRTSLSSTPAYGKSKKHPFTARHRLGAYTASFATPPLFPVEVIAKIPHQLAPGVSVIDLSAVSIDS